MSPLTPYLAGGALLATVAAGTGGYFFGKDVQRDRSAVEAQRDKDALIAASRSDERLLATQAGQLGQALNFALTRGDDRAAPQVRIIHDGLSTTPLALSPDCRVPDGVRGAVANLYGLANGAADAAERAGAAAVGRASDSAGEP